MLRGMWDLPGPGLEPVSSALAGGFLTTAPPGKCLQIYYFRTLTKSTQTKTFSRLYSGYYSGSIPSMEKEKTTVKVFFSQHHPTVKRQCYEEGS